MSKKSSNPRKGWSSAVRAHKNAAPPPAVVPSPEPPPIPLLAAPCDAPLMEAEERTARVSLDLKFPGVGRLLVDLARVFRRRHVR